mmetsp:Transcript_11191/g.41481  ORF Transcript_11191/g.41481 Transcript_11191/m.41481 type:complete len:325 (+) Transcript_11191:1757-2731(+)
MLGRKRHASFVGFVTVVSTTTAPRTTVANSIVSLGAVSATHRPLTPSSMGNSPPSTTHGTAKSYDESPSFFSDPTENLGRNVTRISWVAPAATYPLVGNTSNKSFISFNFDTSKVNVLPTSPRFCTRVVFVSRASVVTAPKSRVGFEKLTSTPIHAPITRETVVVWPLPRLTWNGTWNVFDRFVGVNCNLNATVLFRGTDTTTGPARFGSFFGLASSSSSPSSSTTESLLNRPPCPSTSTDTCTSTSRNEASVSFTTQTSAVSFPEFLKTISFVTVCRKPTCPKSRVPCLLSTKSTLGNTPSPDSLTFVVQTPFNRKGTTALNF